MENTVRGNMLFDKTIQIIFASSTFAKENKIVIGKNGDIPWKELVPSDMVSFRNLTSRPGENSVIMGRKTWDSIPEIFKPFDKNKPLEISRQSIIVTRNKNFFIDDPRVVIAHSLEEAIRIARSKVVWIIGGAEIYTLALPFADSIHQTMVDKKFDGDTFFPPFHQEWKSTYFENRTAGCGMAKNDKIDSTYIVFERKQSLAVHSIRE